jgi:Transposase family tnp2
MKITSLSYMPTHSKSIMVSQMMHTPVFNFSSLRLHLILSRIQKSESNSYLVFSQSNITVVPPLVYVILATMKLYLLAPSAKLTDKNLMERHHKHISSIFPLSHDCVLWFQTHHMPKRCNTSQSTNMTPPRSQTFLIMPITIHSWSLLTIGDEELPMWFFTDPRDIALGFSTDGFGPFKQHNKTAWPLIMFNYNIPPKERFQKKHIISLGTIPKPRKPADMDSFLWPMVQELLQLAIGVSAFDPIAQVSFLVSFYFITFN